MVSYKQIIPATDWFYVDSSTNNDVIIYHIAAWGLTEENSVIGLVSVNGAQAFNPKGDFLARLITIPPSCSGRYKHKNELSEKENIKLECERSESSDTSNLRCEKFTESVTHQV